MNKLVLPLNILNRTGLRLKDIFSLYCSIRLIWKQDLNLHALHIFFTNGICICNGKVCVIKNHCWTINHVKRYLLSGFNFTKPLVQSPNAPAHGIWHKRCLSVSPTELCPTILVHRTRNYVQFLLHMLNALCQKSSVNLLVQKLLMKCWWNWPLVDFLLLSGLFCPNKQSMYWKGEVFLIAVSFFPNSILENECLWWSSYTFEYEKFNEFGQGKLNIVQGRISTAPLVSGEYRGRFLNTANIFLFC